MKRNRIPYIDALRGIAAVMVLFCHAPQLDKSISLPRQWEDLFVSGQYGVQLFFVISAFTMFYTFDRGVGSTQSFFIRRFFRIAPLYFLAVAFYAGYYSASATGVVSNLLFIHGFTPTYINSVVPGGWSVGVEMAFYFTIPVLYKVITDLTRSLYFFAGSLVFTFLVLYIASKWFHPTNDSASFIYFWLPNQLPVFAMGFVVYFAIFQNLSRNSVTNAARPLFMISILGVLALVTGLAIFASHIIFAILFSGILFLLSIIPAKGLVNAFSLYLGKISYSFYLSQYAVMELLRRIGIYSFFPKSGVRFAMLNTISNFFVMFIVTFLVSAVLYKLIEEPFQALGRRLIKRRAIAI